MPLEVSDRLAEQSCADEEKEPCRDDEEDGQGDAGRGFVNDEANQDAHEKSANGSDGDGTTRLAERYLFDDEHAGNGGSMDDDAYPSNEHDCFEALSENGDEG